MLFLVFLFSPQFTGSNLVVAVTFIDLATKTVSGWPVVNKHLDQTSMLRVPVSRLQSEPPVEMKLSRLDQQILQQMREKAKKEVRDNLATSIDYRRLYRSSTLTSHFRREVTKALSRTHRVHRWDIGLLDPDVDSEVFGVDFQNNSSVRFNYKSDNLSKLDELLGDFWDIHQVGNNTNYVTAVTVRCREGMLSVVVQTATYAGPVTPGNHRSFLSDHMAEAAATLCLVTDDTSD